jgi:hypothetical protein
MLNTVIHSDSFRLFSLPNYLVEYPYYSVALQSKVYLYVQGFPNESGLIYVIIHDVKGTEFSAIAQSIAHKVNRAKMVNDQVWVSSPGTCKGSLMRSGNLFLAFLLRLNPILLYILYTLLWFHPLPSLRNL